MEWKQAKVINKNRVYARTLGYMEKQTDGIQVRTESQPDNERQAERFSVVDHRETHRGTSYLYFRSRLDRRRCRLPENRLPFSRTCAKVRECKKNRKNAILVNVVIRRRLTMSNRRVGHEKLVMFRKYWYNSTPVLRARRSG